MGTQRSKTEGGDSGGELTLPSGLLGLLGGALGGGQGLATQSPENKWLAWCVPVTQETQKYLCLQGECGAGP